MKSRKENFNWIWLWHWMIGNNHFAFWLEWLMLGWLGCVINRMAMMIWQLCHIVLAMLMYINHRMESIFHLSLAESVHKPPLLMCMHYMETWYFSKAILINWFCHISASILSETREKLWKSEISHLISSKSISDVLWKMANLHTQTIRIENNCQQQKICQTSQNCMLHMRIELYMELNWTDAEWEIWKEIRALLCYIAYRIAWNIAHIINIRGKKISPEPRNS